MNQKVPKEAALKVMVRTAIILTMILLLSSAASAFTAAEKAELQKLIQATEEIASGMRRAANFLNEPRSMEDRQRMAALLDAIHDASRIASHSLRAFLSEDHDEPESVERRDEIRTALGDLDSAAAAIDRAADLAEP